MPKSHITSTAVTNKPAQQRCMSTSLRRLTARRFSRAMATGALFAFGAASAQAATYNYQGTGTTAAPASGNFSGANFNPTLGTVSTPVSTAADTLVFGGTTTSYTATDDFTAQVSALLLNFTNTVGTVTLARGTGSANNSVKLTNITTSTGPVSIGLDLALQANGTFTVGSGGLTTNGIISGAFTLTKAGTGTLTLSGNNTFTGGGTTTSTSLTINASSGTVTVTNPNAAGTGRISFGGGTPTSQVLNLHIDGGTGGTIAMPNNIGASTGNVATIDVNNNGGGGSNNVIQLNGASIGAGVGNSTFNITGGNGYSLYIASLGSTAGFNGNLTFNPTTANVTLGTVTTFSGGNAHILTLDGTSAGNGVTGAISNGSATFAVLKSNTSTWVLSGNNTYTAGTTVSGGTLQVGNGGTTGSLGTGAVTLTTPGVLSFNLSGPLKVANIISGTGSLTQAGTGTTTLTGANTYSGGTTVSGGVLSGTSSSITGNVTDNATLDFTQSTSGTYAGVISGTGALTKGNNPTGGNGVGGATTLSGINTYTGPTTVTAGTLAVTGSLSGTSLVTATGGTFNPQPGSGSQTASNLTVGDGGGFSLADNAIGVFNTGSLTYGPTSGGAAPVFTFDIFGNGTTTATDLLAITGAATPAGTGTATITIKGVTTATAFVPGNYTLITAASGLGTAGFSLNIPGVTIGSLSYGLSLANSTATQEILTVTAPVAATLYWTGSQGNTWNTISGGNSNFSTDAAGTTNAQSIPGAITDVVFTATTAANFAPSVLGQDFTINSLSLGQGAASASPVTISGANTLTLLAASGTGITVAGTAADTISTNVALGASQSFTNNATGALTLSGSVSGAFGLTTGGTGTTVFAGANTYTGSTTISGGTLQIGNGGTSGTLGTNTGGIANSGTLAINLSGPLTVANVISGTGGVTQMGTGTLTLSGANTYTGTNLLSAGTVQIAADNNLGASGAAVNLNGGTLQSTLVGVINDTHVITVGASGGTIIIPAVNLTPLPQMTFFTANTLLGSGPLTITGGNVRMASANTYSGTMTLTNGGSFEYGTAGAVAAGASFVVNGSGDAVQTTSGELIAQGGSAVVIPNAVSVNGGILSFENGTLGTFSGPITLGAGGAQVATRNWYATGTATGGTMSGVISGTGALTKSNFAGTATLTGANTYSGGTSILGGVLQVGNGGATGSLGTSTGTILDNGGLTYNLSVPLTVANVITGSGTLTQIGGGALTVSGTNTYSGGTIIGNSGGLVATNNSALGTGNILLAHTNSFTGTLSLSGGLSLSNTLTFNSSVLLSGGGFADIESVSGSNVLSGSGTIVGTGGAGANIQSDAGSLTLSGALSNNVASSTRSFDLGGAGNGVVSGTITDGAATAAVTSVVKEGAGTWSLSGTNTYTGATTVNAGTLSGNTGSFGTSAITTNANATVDYSQATPGSASNNITGTGNVSIGGNVGGPNGSGGTITYTGQDTAGSVNNTNPNVPVINGSTNVTTGNLYLNHTGGGALTGPVAVATSGALEIGQDNEIQQPSTSVFTLAGGTLKADGHNEGTPTSAALGRLLLTGSQSTLDFGDVGVIPAANTLAFADSAGLTWTGSVALTNYVNGVDMLYIGQTQDLSADQLSRITFNGQGASQLLTGQVVFAAAPEPSGWVSMLSGAGVLGGIIARKRRKMTATMLVNSSS